MKYRVGICGSLIAALMLSTMAPSAQDQDQSGAPASSGMKVTSCTVTSSHNASKTFDCSLEAARTCNGKDTCEIQIGYNQRRFLLDRLITSFPFGEIQRAVEASEGGEVVKAVLRMP